MLTKKFHLFTQFILLTLFFNAPLYAQDKILNEDEQLFRMVKQIQKNVLRVGFQRPFKFKAMNESLELTAQAVVMMSERSSSSEELRDSPSLSDSGPLSAVDEAAAHSERIEEVLGLLRKATEEYDENHISILLEAMVVETHQGPAASSSVFENFLKKSRSYSKLDERILKWEHFQQVRRSVLGLLESRGVSFEDRYEEIEVTQPFENFYRFIYEPEKEDIFLNRVLLLSILFGGIFLISCGFMGYPLRGPFVRHLGIIYFFVWVAYIIWMIDLFLGLPFELSRHQVVSLILMSSVVFYILGISHFFWKEKNQPVPEGYQLCPHCKKPIPKLSISCFECGKKVTN